MGWEKLANGVLLRAAMENGFNAFVSIDKKLEYEQNLSKLPLPVVVIDSASNALPDLLHLLPFVIELLEEPLDRILYLVQQTGVVLRIATPRSAR